MQMRNRRIKEFILRYRRILIIIIHAGLITLAYFSAFLLRFDFNPPLKYILVSQRTFPLLILVKLAVFWYFGIFVGLWKYVSTQDLWQIIKANIVATILFVVGEVFVFGKQGYPRAVFLIDFIVCVGLVGGIRFVSRFLKEKALDMVSFKQKNVLIIGAGEAGMAVLREYRRHPSMGKIVGFVDDSPVKQHESIAGVKILGNREKIPLLMKRLQIEEVVLAIPSASGEMIRDTLSRCRLPGVKIKIIPGYDRLIRGDLQLKPREVQPQDLLGRQTVSIDEKDVSGYIAGRRVLVTGAGGSIGAEICRQACKFKPESLLILDNHENNLYFLEVELKTWFPELAVKAVVADVKDVLTLRQVFRRYKPHIIFHAAAHKHVPLMEENIVEAVKNNIMGSANLIYGANHYGVERFVLISTDKAVNPVNVMGMTKRVAEMLLQAKAKNSRTKFMAVRFGNVLGSEGSVVPLFKRQIAEGGPVTVTHPEVKRYFMSIPEAAMLVLQAGALGGRGELFILDMGEQIKILDLARELITLSGYVPDKDIKIVFTGLRPGEKLAEELLLDKERDTVTKHEKIYVSNNDEFQPGMLRQQIKMLWQMTKTYDEKGIAALLKKMTTHTP